MRTDQSEPPDETAARGLVSSQGTARAVVYLRVSTTEQAETDFSDEGYSIPPQRDACRRKAEQLGAAVVDEYLDRGESARSAARPKLQSMLQRLRLARDVDYVIVHKIDRLARSREDDDNIVMDIRSAGAQIVSASENIDETPSGKLLHGIMATIAEFYSSNLAAEARKGMHQKAKLGGTPYRAPIGYRNTRAEVDGHEVRTIDVDAERAGHVRWAFETFATGEWTISQLTDALGSRGLTSRGDKRMPAQPLVRSKVHKMLRNPYYVGLVKFNGAYYPGRHEPLIDQVLFDDVQAVLDQRKGTEKPVKRTHYLKGILACGYCKRRLGLSFSSSKNGVKYPYFFCLGRRAHKSNGCTLPYLPMEQVEAKVEEYWSRFTVDSEKLGAIRTGVIELIHLAADQHQADIDQQRLRLERLDAEEQKLLAAHYAEAVSLTLLQKEQKRIMGERANAEGTISALTVEVGAMERTLEEALARIERCDEVYKGRRAGRAAGLVLRRVQPALHRGGGGHGVRASHALCADSRP
jgi:DNA invertase Pin-like site-specific DNA recombinase